MSILTKPDNLRVDLPLERIAAICQRYCVEELSIFGWALRDDFPPDSDVDFLVRFKNDDAGPWMGKFTDMSDDLSALLKRHVDVVDKGGVEQSEIGFAAKKYFQPRASFMKHESAYLLDIVTACRRIGQYVQSLTPETFASDNLRQDAVIRQLEIVGEAVEHLNETFRVAHPEIPWREIAGMRDHLIHGYDKVQLSRVWDTAIKDVPILLAVLEPLLPPATS